MYQTPREEFEELKAGLPEAVAATLENSSDSIINMLDIQGSKDALAAMAVLDFTRAKLAARYNLMANKL